MFKCAVMSEYQTSVILLIRNDCDDYDASRVVEYMFFGVANRKRV